jgi:hypothetical protein
MNQIKWNATFEVIGGPKITLPETILNVDGYDRCDVELKAGEKDKRINIQPGDDVRLLYIARPKVDEKSEYKPDPKKLTYKLNGKGDPISLESQHVVFGYGASKLLSETPTYLLFTNDQPSPVSITVLVGRSAPEPVAAPAPAPPAPPNPPQQECTPKETPPTSC